MGARRPKPTALKERTSVRSNLGLSRLFAVANSLVPSKTQNTERSQPSVVEDKTLKLDDPRFTYQPNASEPKLSLDVTRATNVRPLYDKKTKTLRPETDPYANAPARNDEVSEYGTAVIVPNRKRSKTAAPIANDENTKTQPIGQRTSVTKLQKNETRRREINQKYVALLFLIPAIGLLSYAYFSESIASYGKTPARRSQLTQDQIKERLQYYQSTLGQHLNRERIDVQIENFKQAPSLTNADHKVKPPSMLDGLPLKSEPNNFQPKPDLPADPTYSDAKMGYGLQEEQGRQDFDKQAQRAWVKEFIENARKDGYDVKIDAYGRVKAKAIPLDQRAPTDAPQAYDVFSDPEATGSQ